MAYTAPKNLYVNASKDKIVEEGSEEAAYLLAAEGTVVPDEEAKRLGLGENKQVAGATENKALVQEAPIDNTLSSTSFKPATKPTR